MNIVLIYSDLDNFIVTCIVGTTAMLFILSWTWKKLKSMKSSIDLFEDHITEQNLENYALSFESNEFAVKYFDTKTKITSILISLIVIATPLYEFIETLRPQEFYFFGWGCII